MEIHSLYFQHFYSNEWLIICATRYSLPSNSMLIEIENTAKRFEQSENYQLMIVNVLVISKSITRHSVCLLFKSNKHGKRKYLRILCVQFSRKKIYRIIGEHFIDTKTYRKFPVANRTNVNKNKRKAAIK